MITDEQFSNYINQISDSYEKIKDLVQGSELHIMSKDTQNILGEVSNFRDIACTALRDSHVQKNFNQN